jgi:hypothetical protein
VAEKGEIAQIAELHRLVEWLQAELAYVQSPESSLASLCTVWKATLLTSAFLPAAGDRPKEMVAQHARQLIGLFSRLAPRIPCILTHTLGHSSPRIYYSLAQHVLFHSDAAPSFFRFPKALNVCGYSVSQFWVTSATNCAKSSKPQA